MMQTEVYPGHRILEAMREAPRYADAIHRLLRSAAPAPGAALLDFGAGDGLFVERLNADGYEVHCVEPDERNQSKLKTLSDIVRKDIRDIQDKSYEFIYTINVLEHIINLDEHVKELFRVLKPGGRLFIFVPAFNILWTSLDDEVQHVQRFTRKSMKAVLTSSGFQIQSARYFDSAGFCAALVVRCLEKIGAFRYSNGTVGFYDRYLLPFSLAGDRLMSKTIGKNLIMIANRS